MTLIKDMEGYEIEIKSDVHRKNLIKDSRFYNLRHLTESLIPAQTYRNPFRGNSAEILLSINDFRAANSRIGWVEGQPFGWMEYKRPHIDEEPRDLIIQINDDGIIVGGGKVLLINRQAVNAVKTLKEVAEGRKSETHPGALLGGKQEMAIKIDVPNECYCIYDGKQQSTNVLETATVEPSSGPENAEELSGKKRKLSDSTAKGATLGGLVPKPRILKRSMWRVKVIGHPSPKSEDGKASQPPSQTVAGGRLNMVLVAVKLEGWSCEREFAKEISWL
jgi:hypothetical protein